MAFPLRISAKRVRSIVAICPSAVIAAEVGKALVQRHDLDAAKGFQVDGGLYDRGPEGAAPLSPALLLVALGRLDLFRRPTAVGPVAVAFPAADSKAVDFPQDGVARESHRGCYLCSREAGRPQALQGVRAVIISCR